MRRHAPASIRAYAVGTSVVNVQPRSRAAASTAAASNAGSRSSGVPVCQHRVTTPRPLMCESGMQHSHRSVAASTSSSADDASADASSAACVRTTPFGVPVDPLVGTTSASPGSTGSPARSDSTSARRAGPGSRPSRGRTASPASHARRRSSANDGPVSSTTSEGTGGSVRPTVRVNALGVHHVMSTAAPRTTGNRWVLGARPRTLPAAAAPVLPGPAAADRFTAWRFLAALVASLAIQIGTNYANDRSDGIRGTDDNRVGPARLVGGGLASPKQVLAASLVSFAIAGVAGLALAGATTWWLLLVGVACFAAGWLYTGGPKPYGYYGFGELFVFVFFGLVATVGSGYVQDERISWLMVIVAVPVGMLATALLVVNNLRDIPTDRVSGKKTLAVRIGDRATRRLYAALIWPAGPLAI